MHSVIQKEPGRWNGRKYGTCYLCSMLDGDHTEKPLEEHHIFGGPYRKISEHYGMKVYLCKRHHAGDITGTREAVHHPEYNDYSEKLKQIAQEEFERHYSRGQFIQEFGRSYL